MLPFGARRYRPPILIPGWDFTVGRILTGSPNVATIGGAPNLPANAAYDSNVSGIRIGSAVADFTTADWDFRALNVIMYGQQSKKIRFENYLFDLSRFDIQNNPFIGARSGSPIIEVSHGSFRGLSSLNSVTCCFGQRVSLVEYTEVQDWPSDIFNPTPVPGLDTVIRYNWFRGACSASAISGLHADFLQYTGDTWDNAGNSLLIYGNRIEMAPPQRGGVGLTGIFNFGARSGNWNSDVIIRDNYIDAGGAFFPFNITETNGFSFSGSLTMTNNYLTGIGSNPFYLGAPMPPNVTVNGLYDALTGNPIVFSYIRNDGVRIDGATSIP